MDDESGESMELIEQLPLQARRQEMKWGGVLFSKKWTFPHKMKQK